MKTNKALSIVITGIMAAGAIAAMTTACSGAAVATNNTLEARVARMDPMSGPVLEIKEGGKAVEVPAAYAMEMLLLRTGLVPTSPTDFEAESPVSYQTRDGKSHVAAVVRHEGLYPSAIRTWEANGEGRWTVFNPGHPKQLVPVQGTDYIVVATLNNIRGMPPYTAALGVINDTGEFTTEFAGYRLVTGVGEHQVTIDEVVPKPGADIATVSYTVTKGGVAVTKAETTVAEIMKGSLGGKEAPLIKTP